MSNATCDNCYKVTLKEASEVAGMLCNALSLISCAMWLEDATLCFLSFNLSCMDASIAVKPVFDRFQSVVITSGVCYLLTVICTCFTVSLLKL